jgi:transposase
VIHLTQTSRVFLATAPTDFRRQIDGLVAHCTNQLQHNPRDGALFVFINRAKTMLRILHYDGSGYWLATKRLSKGRFPVRLGTESSLSALEAAQLMSLIKSGACDVTPLRLD